MINRMKGFVKKKLNQKGLTLIELLAVVVILGIIAAIAVPAIGGIIENTKKDTAVANAQMILSGANLYKASNNLAADDDVDYDDLASYLEDITDPWNGDVLEGDEDWTVDLDEMTVSIEYSNGCQLTEKSRSDLSKGRSELEDCD